MPLLIALGLVLDVCLQDGRIDLLEGDLLLTEILKKLPTHRTMALDGVGTVPLLVQIRIKPRKPHLMGHRLVGHWCTSSAKVSEGHTPPQKLCEGKREMGQRREGCQWTPSHNVVVKISLLACGEKVAVHLFAGKTLLLIRSSSHD
jgi:hypothetical protein